MGTISELQKKRLLPGWTERDENEYQEILAMCRVPVADDAMRKRLQEMDAHIGAIVRARDGIA